MLIGMLAAPQVALGQTDTTAPELQSATMAAETRTLTLTYNEELDTGSVPGTGTFIVRVNSAGNNPTKVDVTGSTVVLTLKPTVSGGASVLVSYLRGSDPNPIRDLNGNNAANLFLEPVTVLDATAPELQSATVDGRALALTYSEALDTGSVPAGSAFTVTVDGTTVSLAASRAVAISGSTITLRLAEAVLSSASTVTVSYTVPSTNPIQDGAANAAAEIDGWAVTVVDTSAPVLQSATVQEGTRTLTLTYNEALDAASVPELIGFTVTVNGSRTSHGVSTAGITGTTLVLTLTATVSAGSTVAVSYRWPGTAAIQDLAGNRAAEFDDWAVTLLGRPNRAPVADAGEDLTVDPMAAVTLDGSGSRDPDGDRLRYTWTQVSGEAVELTRANTVRVRFDAPEGPGELVFRLTVSDPDGWRDSDEVRVTVSAPSVAALPALVGFAGEGRGYEPGHGDDEQ